MLNPIQSYFCSSCGDQILLNELEVVEELHCKTCHIPYKKRVRYTVPLMGTDNDIKEVFPEDVSILIQDVKEGDIAYRLVDDKEDTFNVKINGELNGIDTGKKIREKNEQIKKKVAGYEHESKNLRADIESKIEAKHRQEGII